ncbi:50S ribosomal protein L19 [Candidatus Gottesmanbacteria bacterium]|nr:50S ribosomal protein L19 [Candidatus Gottesmanbacteria bacterium]
MANLIKYGETTFHIGDTIRVHYRIIEKEKVAGKAKREVKEEIRERVQAFEGIVIAINGRGNNVSFTVRRLGVNNVAIERIFPLISPWIKKIEVVHKGKVRRAKLYYLRKKEGREAEVIKDKKVATPEKTQKIKPRARKKSTTKK